MKRRSPLPIQLTAASVLVLAASGVLAQESTEETDAAEESKPYTPLGLLNRPQAPVQPGDQLGRLELGAAYVSDDNYMFGQYNGLNDDDASLIGNLQWQQFSGDSYWKTSFTDMDLPTREG